MPCTSFPLLEDWHMRPLTGTDSSANPTPLKAKKDSHSAPFQRVKCMTADQQAQSITSLFRGPSRGCPQGECKCSHQQDIPMMLGDKHLPPPPLQQTSLTLIGCFVTNWAALIGFRPKETQSWTDDCCWLPGRCCQGKGEEN